MQGEINLNNLFKKEKNKVLLAYIAVCVLWGSTYLAIRIGVSEFPPTVFAGTRFLIAGSLMLGFAVFKGLSLPDKTSDVIKLSVVGLFLLLGGNGCVVWAETWVHSGVASLLVATVPLFMALIELALPGRSEIDLKGWIGLIIGFAGVSLLVFSNSTTASIDLKGALILLLGAFLWAVGSVYSKRFTASGGTISHIAIQMLAGGIGLLLTGATRGELTKIHFTSRGLGALAYLIFFGSIIGYSCYIYILKKWSTAKAATYAYVNPPVAVFLGAVILGEQISLKVILSAAIILFGVLLVQTSKSHRSNDFG